MPTVCSAHIEKSQTPESKRHYSQQNENAHVMGFIMNESEKAIERTVAKQRAEIKGATDKYGDKAIMKLEYVRQKTGVAEVTKPWSWPILLTWFTFNRTMDKSSYTQQVVGWNLLLIRSQASTVQPLKSENG